MSITRPCGSFEARDLLGHDRLGVELREELLRLAELLARREVARLPAPDPRLVVTGEHRVREPVVLLDLAELERARDPPSYPRSSWSRCDECGMNGVSTIFSESIARTR